MEHTRTSIVFTTERIVCSLADILNNCKHVPDGLAEHTKFFEANRSISEIEIARGMLSVARGLQFLHAAQNTLHMNVTPESIVITAAGQFKLCGFGLSRPFSQTVELSRELTPVEAVPSSSGPTPPENGSASSSNSKPKKILRVPYFHRASIGIGMRSFSINTMAVAAAANANTSASATAMGDARSSSIIAAETAAASAATSILEPDLRYSAPEYTNLALTKSTYGRSSGSGDALERGVCYVDSAADLFAVGVVFYELFRFNRDLKNAAAAAAHGSLRSGNKSTGSASSGSSSSGSSRSASTSAAAMGADGDGSDSDTKPPHTATTHLPMPAHRHVIPLTTNSASEHVHVLKTALDGLDMQFLPHPLQRMLTGLMRPSSLERVDTSDLLGAKYFATGFQAILNLVDNLLYKEPAEQASDLMSLQYHLSQFPSRILLQLVIPVLSRLCTTGDPKLWVYVLPLHIYCAGQYQLSESQNRKHLKLITGPFIAQGLAVMQPPETVQAFLTNIEYVCNVFGTEFFQVKLNAQNKHSEIIGFLSGLLCIFVVSSFTNCQTYIG